MRSALCAIHGAESAGHTMGGDRKCAHPVFDALWQLGPHAQQAQHASGSGIIPSQNGRLDGILRVIAISVCG